MKRHTIRGGRGVVGERGHVRLSSSSFPLCLCECLRMGQRGHFTQPNHDSLLLSGCRPTVQVHTSQTPPPLPPIVLSSLCLLPCYILPCITHWHSGNILKRGIVAAPCYCQESDLSWGHIPTILIEGRVCLFHLFPITLGFLIFLFCHCLFFFTSSLFPLLFLSHLTSTICDVTQQLHQCSLAPSQL